MLVEDSPASVLLASFKISPAKRFALPAETKANVDLSGRIVQVCVLATVLSIVNTLPSIPLDAIRTVSPTRIGDIVPDE